VSRSEWRRRLVVTLAGLLGTALAVLAAVTDPQLHGRLQNIVFDGYQRLAPRAETGAPITLIDIDEASIDKLGQWPWPRTTIAGMVDRLSALGAVAIGFDIAFSEPDRTSPSGVVAQLQQQGAQVQLPQGLALDNDAVLAKAFAAAPVIAGIALSSETSAPLPPPKAGFSFGGADPKAYLPPMTGGVVNLPELTAAASGMGSFSFPPSEDGVVRLLPLVSLAQGNLYPALSVEALRVAQGAGSFAIRSTGASGEADTGQKAMTAFKVGDYTMPVGPDGSFRIYYSGLPHLPVIPAATLLDPTQGDRLAQTIDGHIVLIGTSALGLRDLVATPFGAGVPGMRVHAEIIDQILGQIFLNRPDWAPGAEIALAMLLGLLVAGIEATTGAIASTATILLLIAIAAGLSWWAFATQRLLLDPVLPAGAAALAFALATPVQLLWTDREKQFIRAAFSHYLAPELVERLAGDPTALRLGGESRELTVLFSDIRDFTAISETLTPEQLAGLLNGFLTPVTDVLLKSEATIDKYIGDAVMAFWNAPLDIAAHPRKACLAALGMLEALADLNLAGGRQLRIGVGINTGDCAVGNFGSRQRFGYSAMGDNVNVASRLEGLTKQYRVPILVSDATRAGAGDLAFLEIDRVQVVGRQEPLTIHALLGNAAEAASGGFAATRAAHERLLAAYRALDFAGAETALAEARATAPSLSALYDLYAERLAAMQAAPPAVWDGVFVSRQK
jgi:adenylate cyclase